MAVPLSPNFPADILDLRPQGPVFVEVKTTRHLKRQPRLSAAEALFSVTCRDYGAKMVLAVVRVGGSVRLPTFSLSYSPVPAVGPRKGPRHPRLRAPVGPPAEPWVEASPRIGGTTSRGSARGPCRRTEGNGGGTTGAATSEPSSGAATPESKEAE